MKNIKVLVLAAILGAAAVNSTAQVGGIAGGFCGAEPPYGMNLMWILYSDSTLRITGSGDMANYFSAIELNRPWENYLNQIKTIIIGDSVTSIGSYAFPPFLYLPITSSVTIGNSVTKIGVGAFRDCFNIASLTIVATIPPILYSNTFQNVSATIPVHVPCGSISAYQDSAYWSNFSNYIGIGFTDTTFIFDTVCYEMPYNNNDFSITEGAGIYYRTIPSVHYCDSVICLTLAEYPQSPITTYSDTICQGETYQENGFNESETGTYTQNLKNIHGCDSIIILNLIVSPKQDTIIFNDTISYGGCYTQNGFNIINATTDSIYFNNNLNRNNCDSVTKLTLTINGVGIASYELVNYKIYVTDYELQITNLELQEISTIEIYNTVGQKLLSFKFLPSSEIIINIESLAKGIYFIKINNNKLNNVIKFQK